ALERISQAYDVYFTFDRDLTENYLVEYSEENYRSAEQAITVVLKETNLTFQIFSEQFVIIYRNDDSGLESVRQMISHLQGFVSQKEETSAQLTRRHSKPITRLESRKRDIQELHPSALNVTGRVIDSDGNPLIGVNILVQGTNIGTTTDLEGQFILNDLDEQAVLVISYIGYRSQEIPLEGRATLTIIMNEDVQTLDEVVVVGYGTQKRVNVIGSMTSIDEKEITASPVSKLSNALAGRLPGAIFMQDGGEPGNDEASIRIRGNSTLGNNSPLIVVDGIPGRDINSLHSNDIESITVLKDASAAIYGARAANGVILVTTKRGSYNVKPKLTYGYFHGFLSPTTL